jgi:hypothetical protein
MEARGHQTQWAAQFAVASELCKRGYEVAFTSGHTTPIADLMVVSPKEKQMYASVKPTQKFGTATCWAAYQASAISTGSQKGAGRHQQTLLWSVTGAHPATQIATQLDGTSEDGE